MSSPASFVGSVPDSYERYLTPFLAPHARDLAVRAVASANPRRILEIACGTGLLTRALVGVIDGAALVATDLNQPMIDLARRLEPSPKVTWRTADAMALPYDDRSFDLVICQFGVMFFPDKIAAASEIRRVLEPGGTFLFNTWASIDDNPLVRTMYRTLTGLFESGPPSFVHVPFGYADPGAVRTDLVAAGFDDIVIEPVEFEGRSPSAHEAARGFIEGNPMVAMIREHGSLPVPAVTEAVARALDRAFGPGEIRVATRAFVVTAR